MSAFFRRTSPFLYGLVHALVDAATVGLLFAALARPGLAPQEIQNTVLLYNALAFALQPVIGIVTDLLRRPKLTMLAGLALALAGIGLLPLLPLAAVVLAAVGNACFHVGAGVIAFFLTPGRATGPGFFVAPGALGLGAGTLLGKLGLFPALPFAGALLLAGLGLFFLKAPSTYAETGKLKIETKLPVLAFGLFFVAIFARAFIGTTAGYSLERSLPALVVLALAGFAGKAAGGIAADKGGWLPVTTAALIASAPLLVFTNGSLALGAAGALLFQAAMPVTLTATAGIMPRTPGLAFGLNCLALFLGQLVDYLPLKIRFYRPEFQAAALALTIALVVSGLLLLRRKSGLGAGDRLERG